MEDDLRELLLNIIRKLGLVNVAGYCCDGEMSVVQGCILHELSKLDRPSMQQVAAIVGMDATTFNRKVKPLIDKGFVRKEVLLEDRRFHVLSLTVAGKEAEHRIDEHIRAYIGQILDQFTSFEKNHIIRSLMLLEKATPYCRRPEAKTFLI